MEQQDFTELLDNLNRDIELWKEGEDPDDLSDALTGIYIALRHLASTLGGQE